MEIDFSWRPQLRDPSDELVLEAAVNGQATFIVTYNVADFEGGAARFDIQTLTPGQFLKEPEKP